MLEDLQIRNYSPTTVRIYLHSVAEFARHFSASPDQLGVEHIRRYQWFLIKHKHVSPSTFIQTVCALRFLYTHTLDRKIAIERIPFPRRERKLPLILSREEVKALLEASRTLRHRAMLATLYGTGLRVSELTQLKLSDIDPLRKLVWCARARGAKIVKPCFRPSCSNCCAPTGAWRNPSPGDSPAPMVLGPSPPKRSSWPAAAPPLPPAFPSPSTRTRCVTPSLRTCSNPAPICAPSRSCWATPTCKPPPAICRWPTWRSAPHLVHSSRSRSHSLSREPAPARDGRHRPHASSRSAGAL